MADYKLSEDILNQVLDYLAKQPYAEVASLIASVQTAQPADLPKLPDSPKTDKKSKKGDKEVLEGEIV